MELNQRFSTVKLEIEVEELFEVLRLLALHERHDLIRKFIMRLYVEEFLSREEAQELGHQYGVGLLQL